MSYSKVQGSSIVASLFCYLVHPRKSICLKDKHKCLILYSAFKRITVKIEKGFRAPYTYIYIYTYDFLVYPQMLIDTAFHRGSKQKGLCIHRSSDISKNP